MTILLPRGDTRRVVILEEATPIGLKATCTPLHREPDVYYLYRPSQIIGGIEALLMVGPLDIHHPLATQLGGEWQDLEEVACLIDDEHAPLTSMVDSSTRFMVIQATPHTPAKQLGPTGPVTSPR